MNQQFKFSSLWGRNHFLSFLLKVEGFFISCRIQTRASSESCLQRGSVFATNIKHSEEQFSLLKTNCLSIDSSVRFSFSLKGKERLAGKLKQSITIKRTSLNLSAFGSIPFQLLCFPG